MRRMSLKVENALSQCGMKFWSVRLAETQWRFIARLKTLPTTSWPSRAAFWHPWEIDDPSCDYIPNRIQGRPVTRWDDRVTNFSRQHFGQTWQEVPHLSFMRALPLFVSDSPN